jgi:hypothetical protein
LFYVESSDSRTPLRPEELTDQPFQVPPGFYGNDTDLICVMPSGRIWLVERPDEGQNVFRELTVLPKDVETYRDVLQRDLSQGHLTWIEAASGESV